jgi:hypothetical protein
MIDQTEKLALCPVSRSFVEDAALDSVAETVSTPPNGWRMPSMQAVREHDARLSLYGGQASTHDDESDDDESEEGELYAATVDKRRDSMREHSFRLPSQSSRRECLAEMRALGMQWAD